MSRPRPSPPRAAVPWLALLAAGLAGWWLWPRPPRAHPAARAGAPLVTPISLPLAVAPTPASSSELVIAPASPDPGPLPLHVLELTAAYEARREADDPAGADALRLRFEALLDDDTAPFLVRTLPPAFLESFFGDLALRHWAGLDRAAAAAWMAAHPSASPVPAAALAHDWVTGDPAGLHAYLDTLPDGEWKHLVAKSAGEEALVADRPGETLRLLAKITRAADPRRDELHEWAVTKWALAEPGAAAAWAARIADTDPALGERLLAAAAVGYANVAPEAAAGWAVRTLAAPEALRAALPAVVRVWAAKDPDAAARWTATLPAGPLKDEAIEGLLSIWAFHDLARAKAWREGIVDLPTRQRADRHLAALETELAGNASSTPSPP